MPALHLDLSLLEKEEDRDAVRLYMKLCRKRVWTFTPSHGMDECDTSAHVAQLFGTRNSGDSLLVSRSAVINPEWARGQPGWTVLEQRVGEAVFTDRAHSVFGLSFLNLAWNVCYASFMETYVLRALRVADRIRQEDAKHTQACWQQQAVDGGRTFCLGPCVLDTALHRAVRPQQQQQQLQQQQQG